VFVTPTPRRDHRFPFAMDVNVLPQDVYNAVHRPNTSDHQSLKELTNEFLSQLQARPELNGTNVTGIEFQYYQPNTPPAHR